jgi:hypothetical protein
MELPEIRRNVLTHSRKSDLTIAILSRSKSVLCIEPSHLRPSSTDLCVRWLLVNDNPGQARRAFEYKMVAWSVLLQRVERTPASPVSIWKLLTYGDGRSYFLGCR